LPDDCIDPAAKRAETVEKLKLLIVEDDADQRELICETLEAHFGRGTVVGVSTGAHALAEAVETFDLVLCDYNLPDATGIELLEAVRSRCNTPVILVTGENVGQIAVDAIRKGATDYVVKLGDYLFTIPLVVEKNLTVAKLMRENETLRVELEQALTDVRDKNAQLEQSLRRVEELAATDPLTGLYNRRHFSRVLDQLFAEADRYHKDLACAMVDMDGFKQLNDTFGHQLGDRLITLAGKVILANLRRMDVVARYGGDEFVVLIPHASSAEAAQVLARVRDEFRAASAALLNQATGVTMSVGVASLRQHHPIGGDQLVAMADVALYRAKSNGRDCIAGAETGAIGGLQEPAFIAH
jgi:diguanylate cyclase (GGDEF)-like protein